jgi:hypothetical protein
VFVYGPALIVTFANPVPLSIVSTLLAPVGLLSGTSCASLVNAAASARMFDPNVPPAVVVHVTVAIS